MRPASTLQRIGARHFKGAVSIMVSHSGEFHTLSAPAIVVGGLAVHPSTKAEYWGGPVSVGVLGGETSYTVSHVQSGRSLTSLKLPRLSMNQAWRVLKAILPLFNWAQGGAAIERQITRELWRDVIEPAQVAAVEGKGE